MLPWALYNLTARDQGSPLIRPFWFNIDTTLLNPVAGLMLFPVPVVSENVLLITSIHLDIHTTAFARAQNLLYTMGDAAGPGNTIFNLKQTVLNANTGNPTFSGTMSARGNPLLMVTDQQFHNVGFNIGPQPGDVTFAACIAGFSIPRGTLSIT